MHIETHLFQSFAVPARLSTSLKIYLTDIDLFVSSVSAQDIHAYLQR